MPEIRNDQLEIFLASRNVISEYYTFKRDELQLDRRTVVAPFSGTYKEVYMELGAYTNTGGKVARAIEHIFTGRLHEFYGMLAWHYSQAEEMQKAEEFMLKAGEEAMKASASSEALEFYREALSIYQTLHKDKADPEIIASHEENIAISRFL